MLLIEVFETDVVIQEEKRNLLAFEVTQDSLLI